MRETYVTSSNGKNRLHVVIWEPEGEIQAVVQIAHGMDEYVKRYDEFARFLNQNGILVLGNDHLGHGKTSPEEDLGYFGPDLSETVVKDLHKVHLCAKKEYGEKVPYILFGHSMGSFLARRHIMTYREDFNAAIISGTGTQAGVTLLMGKMIAGMIGKVKGEHHRSPFLKKMAFSGYNKKIVNPETANDWLTKDKEVVARYNQDKYCTFSFTVNGYQTLFDVISFIQKPSNIKKIPKNLPIFLIAGEEDPVGEYGKGVREVYDSYRKAGIQDVDIKLYPGDRHELTNETDREEVYQDILSWIRIMG